MARNENNRTTAFTVLAFICLIAAAVSYWMNQPPKLDGFELVGKPFYEDFVESSQATSLKVVAMDEDAEMQEFSVEQVDGLWTIPSHHNYPAEAVSRLAATSSSIIGLEREVLAGRLESEFERFGVVDPSGDEATDPETVGKSLTLLDENGEPLADFIIGKQVEVVAQPQNEFRERAEPDSYYYVRRRDENQTFKVKLDIDLSTKFSDWIEPDLLKIERNQLLRVFLDNYEVSERAGDVLGQTKELSKTQGEQIVFERPDGTSPWALEGLKPNLETQNDERLADIIDVLDNVEIVDVRPKKTFMGKQLLTADLNLNRDPEFEKDPRGFGNALTELQMEMNEKGFTLLQVKNDAGQMELDFYSRRGELNAGTNEGVLYTLMFGNPVTDGNREIEIGNQSDEPEEADEPAEEESEDTEGNETDSGSDADDEGQADNRYLMIRVSFDESLLGTKPERPAKPQAPVKPEGYRPAETESDSKQDSEAAESPEEKDDSEKDDSEKDAAPKPEEGDQEQQEEDKPQERDPAFIKYENELELYEEEKVGYELQLDRYQDDLKNWSEKVKAGNKRVDELHERFNQWYYAISADNLDAVQASRSDFVTLANPPKPLPERPELDFPGVEIPKTESPAGGNPAAESPTPEITAPRHPGHISREPEVGAEEGGAVEGGAVEGGAAEGGAAESQAGDGEASTAEDGLLR